MKKNILILVALLIGISFIACEETVEPIENGTINITSIPTGAEIWLDDTNTNKVTPATIEASAGTHTVTLKKEGYVDLSISVAVTGGEEFLLTSNTTLTQFGSLNIESEPAGAEIWLNGTNSGEVTPATITSLESGSYEITLKIMGLGETTLAAVAVADGEQTDVSTQLDFGFTNFGFGEAIKIWETTGTSAQQPSGLDLSTGDAFGTSDGDNNGKIDLYYFSNSAGTTYLVQSADINTNMSRETFFKVSSATDLADGANSSAKDGAWVDSMSDRETNYVFLYDADGNYSKLKITEFGGGSGAGDPAWVKVKWIYNNVQGDLSF